MEEAYGLDRQSVPVAKLLNLIVQIMGKHYVLWSELRVMCSQVTGAYYHKEGEELSRKKGQKEMRSIGRIFLVHAA